MHSARKVANFFIEEASLQGKELTPLQVIKLVYIAHGFVLANTNRGLIADVVEAWEYGPVVADLYHQLKRYGNEPIPSNMIDWIESYELKENEKNIMTKVFNHYSKFTGVQLSTLTHQEGTPWHEVWEKFGKNAIIPDEKTREHYKKLIDNK